MTSQDQASIRTAPSSLTVRAAAGQLRIIPIWQALGQHAAHAKRIRVHCSRKHDFDEMTVTFESVSPAALADISRRLARQINLRMNGEHIQRMDDAAVHALALPPHVERAMMANMAVLRTVRSEIGFVAIRIEGRTRSICEVLLILRDRRIDSRRTDGFLERTSSVLSRSCA